MRIRSLGQEDPLEEGMAPIPVLLTGESHRERSLVEHSPWGQRESDTTAHVYMTAGQDIGNCLFSIS